MATSSLGQVKTVWNVQERDEPDCEPDCEGCGKCLKFMKLGLKTWWWDREITYTFRSQTWSYVMEGDEQRGLSWNEFQEMCPVAYEILMLFMNTAPERLLEANIESAHDRHMKTLLRGNRKDIVL